MKQCRKCSQFKDIIHFRRLKKNEEKRHSYCNACHNKSKRKLNPKKKIKKFPHYTKSELSRHNDYMRSYGISLEQYNILFKEHNGVCWICQKPETSKFKDGRIKNLAVDHSHITGKVRGLLCDAHNRGLGYFQDNPKLLKRAIEYLETKKNPPAQEVGGDPLQTPGDRTPSMVALLKI